MYLRKTLFPSWIVTGIYTVLFISGIMAAPAQAAVGLAGSWLEGSSHAKEPGTNRALVVMVYGEHTADFSCTGITYGGQALTKVVDKIHYTTGNRSYTAAFMLKETGIAAATSGTIAVTWSVTPSSGKAITSAFFTGVDQAAVIGSVLSNGLAGVSTISTGPLANASGDMVLVGGTSESATTFTVNNGFTKGIEIATASWGDAVAAYKPATGADLTPSLTVSSAMRLTIIGFVLKATGGNVPPAVSIISPASGASFTTPANITISATASDADGSVTKVQFYYNTTLLGEDVSSPYSFDWNNAPAGSYSLTAVATDNLGATTTSIAIPITVSTPATFTLTITNDGNASTIPSGSVTVTSGVSTAITAYPGSEYRFSSWTVTSGSAQIANPDQASTTVTLSTGNASIRANCTPILYSLTVLSDNGTVALNPAGGSYALGTIVTLAATPAEGFVFSGWSGDLTGSENPATIEITGNKSVTAAFFGVTVNSRKLSVSGDLRDASGKPVGSNGVVSIDMSVRLMSQATGGSAVYTETFLAANSQAVNVENGFFTLRLGEGTTSNNLTAVLAANNHLFAEITIEGPTPDVLMPRTPLTGSPWTVTPGSGSVLHGSVDPGIGVIAPIGAYYVNDTDGSTWVKINNGWKKVQ